MCRGGVRSAGRRLRPGRRRQRRRGRRRSRKRSKHDQARRDAERRRSCTTRPRRALAVAVTAGYEQVFSVPFGYCDEGPLVIEGLPAECTFSQGWRNYLSDSPEAFLLEPLDVVLLTIDELIADGLLIEPEDAQVLRAIDFRTGYLAGVVQTVHGETGVYGTVVSLTDASGTWSLWIVHGVLSADEVWGMACR